MKDLCRRITISDATFYHSKAKYGGMEVNETRRLRQVEEENGRLKKIVAQQALDLDALKVVLAQKQIDALKTERDEAVKKASQGGGFWSRVRRSVKWAAIGAGIGAAAVCGSGHCK